MNIRTIALAVAIGVLACGARAQDELASRIEWKTLSPLPQAVGGAFTGTHRGALLVAGGSAWTGLPAEGGTKIWADRIYLLENETAEWKDAGALPEGLANGAAVSTDLGVVMAGGSNGQTHTDRVRLMSVGADGSVTLSELPPLPQPCALLNGALLNGVVYVAGGQAAPDSTSALKVFWALDLATRDGWKELEPWPGPARIMPVVAAQDGAIYVVAGADLYDRPGQSPGRQYLADGYRYDPKSGGWKAIQDIPQPIVAAASAPVGPSHIYVFSGDDGSLFDRNEELGANHPGFSRNAWAYHTITDTWIRAGEMPSAPVTTPAAVWGNRIVIPGGEDRPYHRTAEVLAATVKSAPRSVYPIDYIVVGAYFLAMVLMGWYFSRREKTTEDFFRGGQRVPWWAAGLSIFGTVLSAITFLSIPAMAFRTNWVYLIGNFCVILIAPVVVFYYLPFFRRLNVTSAYEYLEKRFSLPVRLFGSLLFILLQLSRVGIVLYLPAITLAAATGIDVVTAIVVMGLLTIAYTALGGIEAVIWTDVVQVLVLLGGAIFALVSIMLQTDGGAPEFFSIAWHDDKFRMFNWTWDFATAAFWVVILGRTFENLIPHTTDQSVIQRYLTTPSEKQAAHAIWLGNIMALPSSLLFFGVGTALYVFYKENPGRLDPTLQTDATFPLFIIEQLPAGVTGLIIAALFAAAMSTLDSGLNSVATVIVTDFYRRFRRTVDETRALALARWITVVMGLFGTGAAIVMHILNSPSLWDQYIRVLGLFGSSLAGLFALGVFTRRATAAGATIGAFTAAGVLALVQYSQAVNLLLYSAIGIVTCFVVGYLASTVIGRNGDLSGLTWSTRKE